MIHFTVTMVLVLQDLVHVLLQLFADQQEIACLDIYVSKESVERDVLVLLELLVMAKYVYQIIVQGDQYLLWVNAFLTVQIAHATAGVFSMHVSQKTTVIETGIVLLDIIVMVKKSVSLTYHVKMVSNNVQMEP